MKETICKSCEFADICKSGKDSINGGKVTMLGCSRFQKRERYRYTINLPPVTKKNSQKIMINSHTGRPFIGQSRQYTEYEEAAGYFLIPQPPSPIDYPVAVRCVFYTKTRRRVDRANLEAAVHDILVKYRILADDNRDIVASTDGSRVYYDKDRPRVEITISPLYEAYEQWQQKEAADK